MPFKYSRDARGVLAYDMTYLLFLAKDLIKIG